MIKKLIQLNIWRKLFVLRLIYALVISSCGFAHMAAAQTFNSPNDAYFSRQTYLEQINFKPAGAENLQPITVAVIDQGVDWTHPDLKNQMWMNMSEIPGNGIDDDRNGFVDDVYGWNFFDNNNDVSPKGGHGTKLAGIIAAQANNQEGIAGIAPNVKIMPLTVCSAQAGCKQSAIISAIYYAANNGAKVINLSLGDTTGYKTAYSAAIAYAYSRNVVIAAAAGSAGQGYDLNLNPISPVCNDNGQNMVLGVGTVDENGNRPVWANYGNCVDVTAPGVNIFTAFAPEFNNGREYGYSNGNSFATAEVSGLAALMFSKNPQSTAAEIINVIIKNSNQQTGLINVEQTLQSQNSRPGQVLGAFTAIQTFSTAKQRLIVR